MEQIKRYPSIAALARDARAVDVTGNASRWYGYESAADSIAKAIGGDDSLVPEAERLLSRINAAIDIPERPMIADVAGAYPIVAEYLAGMPDCMRRRAIVENDAAPVRIMVCVASSQSITADMLARRGAAILALTMALARVRPVELSVFGFGRRAGTKQESVIVAPINTQPLDIASAAYALTSAGFARRLCLGLSHHYHFDGECAVHWPQGYGEPHYLPGLLRRLGGDPSRDLIIDGAHAQDAMLRDPVAWVNAQLAKFREAVQ